MTNNTGLLDSIKEYKNGISVNIDNYFPCLEDDDINDLVDFCIEVCYANFNLKGSV